MPSGEHESAVAAFAAFPDATAALLDRTFHIGLPRHDDAHRGPATFQKLAPTSYHADNTLVFTRAGKRVYALVIEVQRRWVPGKWRAWKYYATSLEQELDVGVLLAVFCPEAGDAERYRGMAGTDRFSVRLWPCLLSLDDLPLVEDSAQARANLSLAALSLICHGGDDPATLVPAFAALYDGMHHADQEVSRKICDMLLVALSKAARDLWEEHMTVVDSEYRSELFRELEARGKTEGKAEGKADSVLRVLSRRGVPVPAAVEEQIRACADLDLLDTWLDRALTAISAEDVVGEPSPEVGRVEL
ncbi:MULTISPECIES: hypothetical protein [Pseudofrankia]|uniref:hypothetical protein n=1 Tax=Pseudofrankia TaxID=2994363 RepID=UPI000234D66B|nr:MULTISPECIES: hypothetical protein [Pseudofrankia]OHV32463.1 hypothetical protein BCD49_30005 [Pseudofrankia sp. EUN1h]